MATRENQFELAGHATHFKERVDILARRRRKRERDGKREYERERRGEGRGERSEEKW